MKRILLATMLLSTAATAFAQPGQVLFENIENSSDPDHFTLNSLSGPAPGSGLVVELFWYDGSSFVLEDTFTSTYTRAYVNGQGPGNFYAGEVTIPQLGTQTFEIAAFYTSGGLAYSGITPPFTANVNSGTPQDPALGMDIGTPPMGWFGQLVLSPSLAPVISGQPVSISTFVGSNVTLNVIPVYENVTFQWQFYGTNIAGATNSTLSYTDIQSSLSFTNIQLTNAGYYDVVLSNAYGSLRSATATVSVGPPSAPSIYVNSNLAALTASAANSASITLLSGFTNGFVFYTLDGSPPTAGSTAYAGPFTLTNSAIIQAIGYSSDFSQSATMQPLALTVTPPLTISTSVSGTGSIGLSPNTGGYAGGSVVTLTATAGSNYVFAEWEGDISSTDNPLTVTVQSNLNLEAVFVPSAYPLMLTTSGGGTVMANGQGSSNSAYFPTNSLVSLTAMPSNGWTFAGWQGGIISTNDPYYLQMTGPYVVAGVFQTVLQTSAVGGGQIMLNRNYPLAYGANVMASAVPNNGNYFVAWSGIASGTNSPVLASVTNTQIDALFAALPANKLSLSVAVLGRGHVNITPQQSYYNYGDQVTLAATWNGAYSFNGWNGAVNDHSSTTVVTVTSNMVVYANFSPFPVPTIGLVMGAEGPTLQVGGLQGQSNEIIYSSSNLVNWQPIYTNAPVTGSFQYTDTNASNAPLRYYRVAVQ